MFYNEHLPPHFHATYGEFNAEISIRDLVIISGQIPPRVLGLVVEWASQHKLELLENWNRAENKQLLNKIDPLQ
jgi:hypothetical protein